VTGVDGVTRTIWLYDDARARAFEPYALTRPASAMLAGTRLVRDRWATVFQGSETVALTTDHLTGLGESDRDEPQSEVPAGSVIVNARCIPVAGVLESDEDGPRSGPAVWRCASRVAAIRTSRALPVSDFAGGTRSLEDIAPPGVTSGDVAGWWVDEPWDYLRWLPAQLEDDIMRVARGSLGGAGPITSFEPPPEHAVVLGEYPVCVLSGVTIEPYVVLDATAGPILLARRASVHAFTRLVGPCFVGEGSTIGGGEIRGSSIGPVCKVRGEVSSSIFVGYANKGHDGFVGHSCIGEWANLGAGTTTSNLKNTYGTVAMQTPAGARETGMQFLGTLFGDHAKTGIGMRLTTGTIVGAAANIYGTAMPPKLVPPFAWGDAPPYGVWDVERFLVVAERVMARRNVPLTPAMRRALVAAYERRWTVPA
jgi:UDP-N-acetylglucosamine diphosphorylase / glucose-1-phosphate thymidylyltransferase / UDP-N-acetylgalactosamine diphosphorylase / glucosamine-1-phosphate N-acetyltransferase / galactosamine-1-phosphate N-acetyltransferase